LLTRVIRSIPSFKWFGPSFHPNLVLEELEWIKRLGHPKFISLKSGINRPKKTKRHGFNTKENKDINIKNTKNKVFYGIQNLRILGEPCVNPAEAKGNIKSKNINFFKTLKIILRNTKFQNSWKNLM